MATHVRPDRQPINTPAVPHPLTPLTPLLYSRTLLPIHPISILLHIPLPPSYTSLYHPLTHPSTIPSKPLTHPHTPPPPSHPCPLSNLPTYPPLPHSLTPPPPPLPSPPPPFSYPPPLPFSFPFPLNPPLLFPLLLSPFPRYLVHLRLTQRSSLAGGHPAGGVSSSASFPTKARGMWSPLVDPLAYANIYPLPCFVLFLVLGLVLIFVLPLSVCFPSF